jgi:hypothetical protein
LFIINIIWSKIPRNDLLGEYYRFFSIIILFFCFLFYSVEGPRLFSQTLISYYVSIGEPDFGVMLSGIYIIGPIILIPFKNFVYKFFQFIFGPINVREDFL